MIYRVIRYRWYQYILILFKDLSSIFKHLASQCSQSSFKPKIYYAFLCSFQGQPLSFLKLIKIKIDKFNYLGPVRFHLLLRCGLVWGKLSLLCVGCGVPGLHVGRYREGWPSFIWANILTKPLFEFLKIIYSNIIVEQYISWHIILIMSTKVQW